MLFASLPVAIFGIDNLVELAYIGIAIIEKWIAFRDRDALNSNPVFKPNPSGAYERVA